MSHDRRFRYLPLLGVVFSLAAAYAPALAQQYTYVGPIRARDSGITCRGVTEDDERFLSRSANGTMNGWWSLQSIRQPAPRFVYCPVQRRNAAPYEKLSDATQIHWTSLDVHVRPGQNGSALNCEAYGGSASSGTYWSQSKQIGAGQADGDVHTLSFANPLSNVPEYTEIVNIGYRCYLPTLAQVGGSTSIFEPDL